MINKEQLKQILADLREVTEGYVEPKIIFQEACSYQRGLMCGESRTMSNYSKQEKVSQNTPKQEFKGSTKPATEKQYNLLKKLKISIKEPITSYEASKLINEKIEKNKQNNTFA